MLHAFSQAFWEAWSVTYPPEAPVISANRPLISLSTDMLRAGRSGVGLRGWTMCEYAWDNRRFICDSGSKLITSRRNLSRHENRDSSGERAVCARRQKCGEFFPAPSASVQYPTVADADLKARRIMRIEERKGWDEVSNDVGIVQKNRLPFQSTGQFVPLFGCCHCMPCA